MIVYSVVVPVCLSTLSTDFDVDRELDKLCVVPRLSDCQDLRCSMYSAVISIVLVVCTCGLLICYSRDLDPAPGERPATL